MRRFILGIALLPCLAVTAGASVVFSDGNFAAGTWSAQSFVTGSGYSSSSGQVGSGGNPGAYLSVTNTLSQTNTAGSTEHLSTASVYDPAVSGVIAGLDVSIDYDCLTCTLGGMGYGFALEQGGNYFVTAQLGTGSVSGWNSNALSGLTSASFSEVFGDDETNGAINPDFSASGAPITFGFETWNASGAGLFTDTAGFDNWQVTVNPTAAVPEPASLALFAAALAGLTTARRRFAQSRTKVDYPKLVTFSLTALLAAVTHDAQAAEYSFSDTFGPSGPTVTGYFDGNASGNSITDLTYISVFINGVPFAADNGNLFSDSWDIGTGSWVTGGAVVSFDGSQNNFQFIDVNYPTDLNFTAYFYSISIPGKESEAYGTDTFGMGNPAQGTSAYNWTVSQVPEPASVTLFGVGLLALGSLRRRRAARRIAAAGDRADVTAIGPEPPIA